ncbi:MAG: carbohydrate ABC transporter substrate-binding protein [Deltaproteobacteria bacterium]|nr:carbohydrate ABC transporter substrate-binding protein [Deltaproteobacteria bacterium]
MAVLILFCVFSTSTFAGQVEVLHWWTSGGEAKSVAILKGLLEKEGHSWKDMAVAGGAGENAMTVLKTRAMAGNPPTAAQVKGPAIQEWAREGLLANLDPVAKKENWDKLVPSVVTDIMKYQGHYVAVPVNVHKINWMWCNPSVFIKAKAKIPTTWAEFETAAKKIKAAGFIPVAFGGQAWQEATVFESVVIGQAGAAFYKKALVDTEPGALNSPQMIKALKTFKMIKKYTDKNAPGRDWNMATSMVIKGEAAMQFMGDWAKGEFTAAGKNPGTDYVAIPAPESAGTYLFNIDSFIMFKQKDKSAQQAQNAMARLILGKKFQEVFNVNKGSIPVRSGIAKASFDDIALRSMDEFAAAAANGTLMPSMAHGMAVYPAVQGAIYDVVTEFYNSDMTAKEAAAKFVTTIAAAK